LALVCAMLCAPPLWAAGGGSGVGGFRMFTKVEWVRLTIELRDRDQLARRLGAAELSPHLGRDARRIVLPALNGFSGETAVVLLAEGLPDLARLACQIGRAPSARVQLERGSHPTLVIERACQDDAR
jgi:hypothetical protein